MLMGASHITFKIATAVQWLATPPQVAWVGGVLYALSLCLAVIGWKHPLKHMHWTKIMQLIMLTFWTIVPPVVFWIDFYFLKKYDEKPPSGEGAFDAYKYGIELSSKIWIALSSVLLFLYFGRDIKG